MNHPSVHPSDGIFGWWIYRSVKLLKLYHSLIIIKWTSNDENQNKNKKKKPKVHDRPISTHIWFCVQITVTKICWLSNNQFQAKKMFVSWLRKSNNLFTQKKIDISTFYWWFNHVNERHQQCPKIKYNKTKEKPFKCILNSMFGTVTHRKKITMKYFEHWTTKGNPQIPKLKTQWKERNQRNFDVMFDISFKIIIIVVIIQRHHDSLWFISAKLLKMRHPFLDMFSKKLSSFFYQNKNMTVSRMNRWTFQTHICNTQLLHAKNDCKTWLN